MRVCQVNICWVHVLTACVGMAEVSCPADPEVQCCPEPLLSTCCCLGARVEPCGRENAEEPQFVGGWRG